MIAQLLNNYNTKRLKELFPINVHVGFRHNSFTQSMWATLSHAVIRYVQSQVVHAEYSDMGMVVNWAMCNYLSSTVMQLAEQEMKPMTAHIYNNSINLKA